MAVGPSHMIQLTFQAARITTRDGATLLDMSLYTLFALDAGNWIDGPRVEWDGIHGRWIAVMGSFNYGGTQSYLNLAVSDTADPTGSWTVTSWIPQVFVTSSYHLAAADFPDFAVTSDKVVLAGGLLDLSNGNLPLGAGTWVVPWSDIASNTPTGASFTLYDTMKSIHVATDATAGGAVHMLGLTTVLNLEYAKITGIGATLASSAFVPAPLGGVWPAAAPAGLHVHQLGSPATLLWSIGPAIKDTAYRNGILWIVSDYPSSFDAGATWNLSVLVSAIDVSGVAPVYYDEFVLAQSGIDQFGGGLGISGDRHVFLVWSRSSPTEYISTRAAVRTGLATLSAESVIDVGTRSYTSTFGRWSDYIGIAADPLFPSVVWQGDEAVGYEGSWRTKVSRLVYDTVAPTASAPTQELITNSSLSAQQVPVRVRWSAADAGSGISNVRIDRCLLAACAGTQLSGSAVSTSMILFHRWVTSVPSPADLVLRYQYQAIGVDGSGNASTPSIGLALAPVVTQQTTSVVYTGVWKNASNAAYSGGTAKYSTAAGAKATFTFSGRSVGFVSYRAPGRGKVKIYLDGKLKGTFSLAAATVQARRIIYAATTSAATHKLQIVVVSGKVLVDAFVVLK